MNFAKIIVNEKVLGLVFGLALVAALLRSALTPTQYTIFCDQHFPVVLEKAVKQEVAQAVVRSVAASELCKLLQEKYPLVRSVTLAYKGSRAVQVMIKAYSPSVCIAPVTAGEREYVICSKGNVIEKKYFKSSVLEGLPVFFVEGADYERKRIDPALINCARDLKRSVYDEFKVSWRSKTEILLQSIDGKSILIADITTVGDTQRHAYIAQIVRSDPDRYENGIKADMRLRDQNSMFTARGKMKNQSTYDSILVALDVGTTKISVLVAQKVSEEGLSIIGIGKAPSLGVSRGVVVDIAQAVHAIKLAVKEAELMAGCKIESACIGISGSHIQSANLPWYDSDQEWSHTTS